ncbi:MAG: DUF503 domain-containing protein [Chloroflexi bacterium]|jgi:uncharacterized protein YlxP (DUF503 family)|nr:DUF503 domain-containing protein [Chloroflexota bacterium]
MVIVAATLDVHLPGSASLKEKRGRIKPLIARLHKTFDIAVAEVDFNDVWQSAALGIAIVSNEAGHAESKLENVLRWIEQNWPDVEVEDYTYEVIHFK